MKRSLWLTRDSVKGYFPLPKEIFSLGLSAAEIAVYAYLPFCEDRQNTDRRNEHEQRRTT